MILIHLLLLSSTLLFSSFISAASVTIENAYVRATPPHTKNSAAFMQLTNNTNKELKLVAVTAT